MPVKDETKERSSHYLMSLRVKSNIGETLEDLAKHLSDSKTSVIVRAIRELAVREGVPIRKEE